MARVIGTPGRFTSPQLGNLTELEIKSLAEARINLGMVTMIDAENIPQAALQYLKNATVRFDRTSRRAGSTLYTVAVADAQPVLKVALIKLKDRSLYTLRFTPSGVQLRNGPGWIPLTLGISLGGGVKDRIDLVDVLDKIIFTNNGVNQIQTIDFATNSVGHLGNAPAYRSITGFYNRAVGFARAGVNEVEVGWSADGDATEWNPAINESAGSTPLLDTPDDLSDFVKSGFAFTNVMLILREKSLWAANKQPIPSNPFYFYPVVPGIGCDCAYSGQIIDGGLAWVDTRTATVYAYSIGAAPEAIGRPIDRNLIAAINDPSKVFSAYSPRQSEYTVYIPIDGSDTVQAWTFNFISKAWTYNEYLNLTSADDPEASASGIRIQDLTGAILELTGSIEDLSPIINTPIRLYGFSDGRIGIEDENANDDCGDVYDTVATSKIFRLSEFDQNIAKIVIEYEATNSDPITLEYSTNGGATNASWRTAKTIIPTVFGEPVNLIFRRVIKCRRFAWRVTTRSAKFSIRSYEVHSYQAGESKGS